MNQTPSDIDLNLLLALDALLVDNSVTGAARRLGLSTSAMSRTLTRLRAATGDPLLVRAGRGLVPTPHAALIRDDVYALAAGVRKVLSPPTTALDLATLERSFTIRANEGFVHIFSARLLTAVGDAAPGVRLRFAPKPSKESGPLRDGEVDLEIGVPGAAAPEIRLRSLFRDRFVGVVRPGHPLLAGAVTAERYAACRHVVASRRGSFSGPVDAALQALGLARHVVAVVPGFLDALQIAGASDLVALVPRSCAPAGLACFELPVPTPEIAVSAMWHPRLHADPAHRWLRTLVADLCRAASG